MQGSELDNFSAIDHALVLEGPVTIANPSNVDPVVLCMIRTFAFSCFAARHACLLSMQILEQAVQTSLITDSGE